MEKYWMVHRPGLGGGSPNVAYDNFPAAAKEAMRLARKELTRIVVLEAVASYQPSREQDPISLDIERIGLGPQIYDEGRPEPPPDTCEHEGCNCDVGHPGPCPPEEGCSCGEGHPEPPLEREECGCYPDEHTCPEEPEYHAALDSGGPGCSCYWCDPENHDADNCEFPNCGCKILERTLAHVSAIEQLTEALELEADNLGLIPKADCPCGCTDEDDPSRGEWLPEPGFDLSSRYAGWTIADFENSLARNRQARSDLCAGLLERRGKSGCTCKPAPNLDEYIECDSCRAIRDREPGSEHWCPHCGYDVRVERPTGTGLEG